MFVLFLNNVLFLVSDNNPGCSDVLWPQKVSRLSGQYSGIRSVSHDMLLDMCEKSQAAGWMAFLNISLYFYDAMVPRFLGWFLFAL